MPIENSIQSKPIRVLKVCAIDSTAWVLLRTQMEAMQDRGWEVSVACSDGPYLERLRERGISSHPIPIARSTNIKAHAQSIWQLFTLIRKHKFDVVHVHTPVASLVGRLAAKLAGVPLVLYTAHGFYFHDEMPASQRRRHVILERIFGRLNDHLFTQSSEDADTAVREKIAPEGGVTAIGNGVILEKFQNINPAEMSSWRHQLGIPEHALVVGIVGRVVEEKGYREFFQAASIVLEKRQDVAFVVVGSSVQGDRDGFEAEMSQFLAIPTMKSHVFFTGFSEDIPTLMNLMDVFVLPSYREGMPRSIIEAMASSKPVIATNIRGCREEVVEGETGYLIPLKDANVLADRILRLLADPNLRLTQGDAGRRRAEQLFHENQVVDRLLNKMDNLLQSRGYKIKDVSQSVTRPEKIGI